MYWKCRFGDEYSYYQASQVVLVVKNLPTNAGDIRRVSSSLGREDPLEEGMATHSSILAWRFPWTKEPGRLQSIGSQRVKHNWSNLMHAHTHISLLSQFLRWKQGDTKRWGGRFRGPTLPLPQTHTGRRFSLGTLAWSPHSTNSDLRAGNPRRHHCSPGKAGMGEVQSVRRAWGDSGGLQPESQEVCGEQREGKKSAYIWALFPRLSSHSEAKL